MQSNRESTATAAARGSPWATIANTIYVNDDDLASSAFGKMIRHWIRTKDFKDFPNLWAALLASDHVTSLGDATSAAGAVEVTGPVEVELVWTSRVRAVPSS